MVDTKSNMQIYELKSKPHDVFQTALYTEVTLATS